VTGALPVHCDKRDDIKLMKRLTIFASLLLSSCAIGDFTPYSGQQQNWPTQPGAFVSTKYVIPVYIHSYPDRPYIVLGYLDATTAPIRNWVGGPVSFAAQRAKELGRTPLSSFNRVSSTLEPIFTAKSMPTVIFTDHPMPCFSEKLRYSPSSGNKPFDIQRIVEMCLVIRFLGSRVH
jgi:hypothetical protein